MELVKWTSQKCNFLLLAAILCCTSSSFSQVWKDLYRFTPAQTLNKIKFLDAQTGLTAGSLYNGSYENIHITHDGGKTWSHVNSGYTAMRFMDIFILDAFTMYMSGNEGIIIQSIDGGQNWTTLNTGTKEQLWGIHFVNKQIGIAVGSNGIIIRTTNGGKDWSPVPSGIPNLFYDVFFTEQGIGFASGSNVMYKSIDLGESWQAVSSFPFQTPADWIRCIKMVNEKVGYACADIGRIYKTIDGGDHWERLNSGVQDPLFELDFTDELIGMVCGFNGIILKTSDGGNNWTQIASPLGAEHLYSIDLVNQDQGYICTHTGHILKMDLRSASLDSENPLSETYVYPSIIRSNAILHLGSNQMLQLSALKLCSMTGNCDDLNHRLIDDGRFELDIDAPKNGIYFIKLESKQHQFSIPVIIAKN